MTNRVQGTSQYIPIAYPGDTISVLDIPPYQGGNPPGNPPPINVPPFPGIPIPTIGGGGDDIFIYPKRAYELSFGSVQWKLRSGLATIYGYPTTARSPVSKGSFYCPSGYDPSYPTAGDTILSGVYHSSSGGVFTITPVIEITAKVDKEYLFEFYCYAFECGPYSGGLPSNQYHEWADYITISSDSSAYHIECLTTLSGQVTIPVNGTLVIEFSNDSILSDPDPYGIGFVGWKLS